MDIKPAQWTHNHTHRLFHLSMITVISALIILISGSFAVFLAEVHASDSQTASSDITVSIPTITTGPSGGTGTGGNGGTSITDSGPAVPNEPTQPSQPVPPSQPGGALQAPTVDVSFDQSEGQIQNGVFIFFIQTPHISGHTNIPNAEIFLDIVPVGNNDAASARSVPAIRSSTQADANGAWQWTSPIQISAGSYIVKVHAEDPNVPAVYADVSKPFGISSQTPGSAGNGNTGNGNTGNGNPGNGTGGTIGNQPPVVTPSQTVNPFTVTLQIPEQFKKIQPGGEVAAIIHLLNFSGANSAASNGAAGNSTPTNLELEYIIRDSDGNIIMDSFETVQILNNLTITKTFYTHGDTAEGNYTLIVKVPVAGIIATAYDTFMISGRGIIPLAVGSIANFTLVFQAFIALLFLFLLVLYFEYNRIVVLSAMISRVNEESLKTIKN